MRRVSIALKAVAVFGAATLMGSAPLSSAQEAPFRFSDAPCVAPPYLHCPDRNCPNDVVTSGGATMDRQTGRNYFLDYPCDLKPDEKVTVVLSLHGGGSYANWQRNYFPLMDQTQRHRLVVATPYSRGWGAGDDAHLQNIFNSIIGQIGKDRVKGVWFVAHSAGGSYVRRNICSPFWRDKVDGFVSIGSGRIGSPSSAGDAPGPIPSTNGSAAGRGGGRGGPPAGVTAPGRAGSALGRGGAAEPVFDCDFSFIFGAGEYEAITQTLPVDSSWAAKYGCGPRGRREVVDTRPGYVHDPSRQEFGNDAWGRLPRPGTTRIMQYPGCRDSRVVADVVRMNKGHTEGWEPRITEEMVKLMVAAPGGKFADSAWTPPPPPAAPTRRGGAPGQAGAPGRGS